MSKPNIKLSAHQIKAGIALVLEDNGKTIYDLESDLQKLAADKGKKPGKPDKPDDDKGSRNFADLLTFGPIKPAWGMVSSLSQIPVGMTLAGAQSMGNLDQNMSLRDQQIGTVNAQSGAIQRAIQSLQNRLPNAQ